MTFIAYGNTSLFYHQDTKEAQRSQSQTFGSFHSVSFFDTKTAKFDYLLRKLSEGD